MWWKIVKIVLTDSYLSEVIGLSLSLINAVSPLSSIITTGVKVFSLKEKEKMSQFEVDTEKQFNYT